jgi:hypothetical protein
MRASLATRQVIVLSNERAFAADGVIALMRLAGVDIVRINSEDRPMVPDWSPSQHAPSQTAIWWRQFIPEAAPARSVLELDDRLVVGEQWRTWISIFDAPGTYWMNPIWSARSAENKVNQLRIATSCGFDVPPTLVTNSSASARAFRQDVGPCILKTLRAGYFGYSDSAFMFTRRLTSEILDMDEWEQQPIIVQARIEPRVDIRLFVVHGSVAGAASTKTHHDTDDWRTASHEVEWWPWTVPASMAAACIDYTHRFNLEYCAFDFASDDERIWFLEGNQAGEFSFLDRPLELGIGSAIANALAGSTLA